jgi:hypothetical protein
MVIISPFAPSQSGCRPPSLALRLFEVEQASASPPFRGVTNTKPAKRCFVTMTLPALLNGDEPEAMRKDIALNCCCISVAAQVSAQLGN